MIDGTPEPLHWYQTITKSLTGCTISNAASQVDYGAAYTTTLRIKGASLPASNDSYSAIALHNGSGTFSTSTYLHSGLTWNGMTFNNVGDSVVVTNGGEHYFRVSLICTDALAVIATINEPIT